VKENPYWFFQKWGIQEPSPLEVLEKKIQELEDRVRVLEEENVGQSNALYECWNSLRCSHRYPSGKVKLNGMNESLDCFEDSTEALWHKS
jgi:hypothetical protein